MKDTQILTLSKKTYSYTILDAFTVDIEETANPYGLPLEELFIMAARINKKRSFLFVSKVLGKHLPVPPKKGLLTGALLAARYAETVKGWDCHLKEELVRNFAQNDPNFQSEAFLSKKVNPVIIGFAETATSLGHAFFDCFEQAEYFHTTREEISGHEPCITFEEEHSHATSHRCYIPLDMINNDREVILVDDEMTTGKTAINIIQALHAMYPRKEYTVVSILDWRSEENKKQFIQLEETLGIKINSVSLVSGKVQVKQIGNLDDNKVKNTSNQKVDTSITLLTLSDLFESTNFTSNKQAPFIAETGRFGVESNANKVLHNKISEAASVLRKQRTGRYTLCLGTGEFMYIPMKIAAELGRNVFYQSTTRSPIYIKNHQGYGAKYGIHFPNPEDHKVSHYVYNIPPSEYDELFIFFERETALENLQPLLEQLEKLQIKSIKIVFFSHEQGC